MPVFKLLLRSNTHNSCVAFPFVSPCVFLLRRVPLLLKCASVDATRRRYSSENICSTNLHFCQKCSPPDWSRVCRYISSNLLPRLNPFDSIARRVRSSKLLLENLSNRENRVFLRAFGGLNFLKDALARQNFSRGEAAVTRLHLFQGDAGFIRRKIDREQA